MRLTKRQLKRIIRETLTLTGKGKSKREKQYLYDAAMENLKKFGNSNANDHEIYGTFVEKMKAEGFRGDYIEKAYRKAEKRWTKSVGKDFFYESRIRRNLLRENMEDLISAAEDYIDRDGDDYDTMEEFLEWAEEEGYDLDDAEEAWESVAG